jgi:hypothetical protein
MIKQFYQSLLNRGYDNHSLNQYFSNITSRDILIERTKISYEKWRKDNTERNDDEICPVRFHLTYDRDTSNQLHSIKEALDISNTAKFDTHARIILGDGQHAKLSISNLKNCGKLLK